LLTSGDAEEANRVIRDMLPINNHAITAVRRAAGPN
jgi:hypothetical protein